MTTSPMKLTRPAYPNTSIQVPNACYETRQGQAQWYPPVMIGADTLAETIARGEYLDEALALMERLDADEYTTYLRDFYREGMKRFGVAWKYADIVTVLLCLSETLKPRTYLEIGVRRGRSACAVASKTSYCSMFLFDMWMTNYAGMENP
ncbi:MAG: hypothetical protein KDE14_15625, partial [Rhodobacteraceae bacterium]|nr:hypothetical protein [Paracoccaceae bacterium]